MRQHRPTRTVLVVMALGISCGACVDAVPGGAAPVANPADAPAAPAAPDTDRITISMTAATVDALAAAGYALYGFKAVGAPDRDGRPVVWFMAEHYSLVTTVTWRSEYQAFTAVHDDAPSVSIDATAAYNIAPGQMLEVLHATGTGTVQVSDVPDAISIDNKTAQPFTCGVSQKMAGGAAPVVEFPLYGQRRLNITPREQVLLVFTTLPIPAGTPVTTSPGLAILIDLTGAHEREIGYDINTGWITNHQTWAREVPVGSDIVPLLIVSGPSALQSPTASSAAEFAAGG
jgi:hypothetical protein